MTEISQKFFKAINKKDPGDVITFGLEDIFADCVSGLLRLDIRGQPNVKCNSYDLEQWLKDYEVFYKHQGGWFRYNDGDSSVSS